MSTAHDFSDERRRRRRARARLLFNMIGSEAIANIRGLDEGKALCFLVAYDNLAIAAAALVKIVESKRELDDAINTLAKSEEPDLSRITDRDAAVPT